MGKLVNVDRLETETRGREDDCEKAVLHFNAFFFRLVPFTRFI